jgi:rod shape-determining protein MreB
MFDWFLGLFSRDLGVDLGTANTLVAVRGEGIVVNEPSVVAVRKGTNEVLMGGEAVGSVAKQMWGKTPANIQVVRPLKHGVIADFGLTEAMLSYFTRKLHRRSWGVRPRVLVAVPSGLTAVEKRAVFNSVERAGAREAHLIREPLAAAIGAGLPITEPTASFVVDIGGGTTEIAVLAMGGIVVGHSLREAGDDMDEAIMDHMKSTYNLFIGQTTAEQIKIDIGSAAPLEEEQTREVRGRDLLAGVPRSTVVRSEEIREALEGPVDAIISAMKGVLSETAPELASDLMDRGIVMTGGGSLLRGIDTVISQETGLPVEICEDPLLCVARGTAAVLEQLDDLQAVLESSRDAG